MHKQRLKQHNKLDGTSYAPRKNRPVILAMKVGVAKNWPRSALSSGR
jgi:hypothetical protein